MIDLGAVRSRFEEKFIPEPNSGCWLWMAGWDPETEYGDFWNGVRQIKAHRASYEIYIGPIPDKHQIDHLCRVRSCVNPSHLQVVTHSVNQERRRTTHCKRGHAMTSENVYVSPQGYRQCRVCHRPKLRKAKAINTRICLAIENHIKAGADALTLLHEIERFLAARTRNIAA
jgi:hypothetical protein